ncbi:MAG TPA: glycosyltransferase family 39 protein [Thermoanaerobaculia bacterium]
MSSSTARLRASAVAGLLLSFVTAAAAARLVGPALLVDPDPAWALPRLALGLAFAACSAFGGALGVCSFYLFSGTGIVRGELAAAPFPRAAMAVLAAAAIVAGTALRFTSLATIPEPLWVDDASLVETTLALRGRPGDFADAIRPAPAGVARPYGSVGVLYLEGYRLALRLAGTTVFGVRLPSALAGSASIVTAALLGRAFLPGGGSALAALVLAGLRWSLVLSRWGWNMIALAPISDAACLLMLRARRRDSAGAALAAGAVAGAGAHVYLSAWIVAAGLLLLALWPGSQGESVPPARRLRRAALLAAGFALAAAPLFLLRADRRGSYFARTSDHSVLREIAREKSALPPVFAAADALAGPWALSDPSARNDLPGRRRLGWIVGVPAFVAFARCLARPREDLSALLLSQALAAAAATVAGGRADVPNGARFAYWTTLVALAAAAGTLALVGAAGGLRRRRAAALVAIGLLAIGGARSARDVLVTWPDRRETFDAFHGQDTLLGRAEARWALRGPVSFDERLAHSPILVRTVARWRLDPEPPPAPQPAPGRLRSYRIVAPQRARALGRPVERIADAWGRTWGVVVAEPAKSAR